MSKIALLIVSMTSMICFLVLFYDLSSRGRPGFKGWLAITVIVALIIWFFMSPQPVINDLVTIIDELLILSS